MFGLSWGQVFVIVLVGVFLLGPERIPTAVQWTMSSLKKVRTMAAGAQAQLRNEIGPELDELRRQVAELQSLKEVAELRQLRDLHPRAILGKALMGEDLSAKGLLGIDTKAPLGATAPAVPAQPAAPVPPPPAVTPRASAPPVSAPAVEPPTGSIPFDLEAT